MSDGLFLTENVTEGLNGPRLERWGIKMDNMVNHRDKNDIFPILKDELNAKIDNVIITFKTTKSNSHLLFKIIVKTYQIIN